MDVLELGMPFSDPTADGPVIQAAANRALAAGVTLEQIFERVSGLRKVTRIPILLTGYWNVFLQYGRQNCVEAARSAGVDGFIIADLPPEADPEFFSLAAEILESRHDPRLEKRSPPAIHGNAGQQRILAARQPTSQFAAVVWDMPVSLARLLTLSNCPMRPAHNRMNR